MRYPQVRRPPRGLLEQGPDDEVVWLHGRVLRLQAPLQRLLRVSPLLRPANDIKASPISTRQYPRTSLFLFEPGLSLGSIRGAVLNLALVRLGPPSSFRSRLTFLDGWTGFALDFALGGAGFGIPSDDTASLSSSSWRRVRFRAIFASRSNSLQQA